MSFADVGTRLRSMDDGASCSHGQDNAGNLTRDAGNEGCQDRELLVGGSIDDGEAAACNADLSSLFIGQINAPDLDRASFAKRGGGRGQRATRH